MKRLIWPALSILCLFWGAGRAEDMNADLIVEKADDVMNQETSVMSVKMTITTTSGQTRELFFKAWSKDKGEKALIRYTAPRRIKDQAMLLRNNADDIWSYFPRTGRVRKLATHAKRQKVQGSDFSYEDMGSGDSFLTDFDHKLLGEEEIDGNDCYKVELSRKDGVDSNYSRIIAWIDKERFVFWRLDYYSDDEPDMVSKRLILSDLEVIDGVPTQMMMVMKDLLDGTDTSQQILEVSYNVPVDDEMFTERGLKK